MPSGHYYQWVEDVFEEFEEVCDERFTGKYCFFRAHVKQVITAVLIAGFPAFEACSCSSRAFKDWLKI